MHKRKAVLRAIPSDACFSSLQRELKLLIKTKVETPEQLQELVKKVRQNVISFDIKLGYVAFTKKQQQKRFTNTVAEVMKHFEHSTHKKFTFFEDCKAMTDIHTRLTNPKRYPADGLSDIVTITNEFKVSF